MKNKFLILFILPGFFLLNSCDWFKGKAKQTINKSGEIVSKSGSEFVSGVESGIEKSFASQIVLSDNLKNAGIEVGKVSVSSAGGGTDNVLDIYLIFNKDFNKNIQAKVFSAQNEEYGRVSNTVTAKANEARYVDFTFDKRTNIDGKGKILLQ